MDDRETSPPCILLDACCVLNLYATGRMADILRSIPCRFAIAEAVRGETIYVLHGGEGEHANEPEPVDLQPLIDSGLIEVMQPDNEDETASYVNFSVELDDGEAMTCALALHRSAEIATDDRKTLRILGERALTAERHTTAGLIKRWAESCQIDTITLRRVLKDIRSRARFEPGKHDVLQTWWRSSIEGEDL